MTPSVQGEELHRSDQSIDAVPTLACFGGSTGTPIINYPEVAILAVGRLQEKAIVQNGAVIVRPMLPLAMSFDHRLIDGAASGAFLARFRELVENPQQLMLDML